MSIDPTLQIKRFFKEYEQKEKMLSSFKIMHEIPLIKSLLKNYNQIEGIALKLIENEAPHFNIFDILRINHLEAKVHSPFLAELLNPLGSHRQGRLFFNAFIKHLFPKTFKENSIDRIRIKIELSDYEKGRMDIVIFYEENNIPKVIIIENKIYHHDELNQLERYYGYVIQEGFKEGNFHLVYLTPYKTIPSNKSISEKLYKTLKDMNALTEWGYYDDISHILEPVQSEIKAPIVSNTIIQYINTINNL